MCGIFEKYIYFMYIKYTCMYLFYGAQSMYLKYNFPVTCLSIYSMWIIQWIIQLIIYSGKWFPTGNYPIAKNCLRRASREG